MDERNQTILEIVLVSGHKSLLKGNDNSEETKGED